MPLPRRYEGPSGGDTLCPPAHGTQEAGEGVTERRVSVAMAISGDAAMRTFPGWRVGFHRSMHATRGTYHGVQEGCHYTLVWVSAYLGMGMALTT